LLRINNVVDAAGYYGLDTLAVYGPENSADPAVLTRTINKMVSDYPADSYGMIFFSHASGWLPRGMLSSPRSLVIDGGGETKEEMEYTGFASAIPDGQFDFIIFEACLMADVMSMYELRNKTGYILASSAEIESPGFVYTYKDKIMTLFDIRQPVDVSLRDFGQACYNRYGAATISLIHTKEMEALASATKAALQGKPIDETALSVDEIQRFDRPEALISSGYKRSRYFDFAHAVEKLAPESRYATFNEQLEKVVVWKAARENFLLGYNGFLIERHSGLTTYIEQDVYPELNSAFRNSSWYKAIQ
jgi:hypothetical protein